MISAAAREVD